MLPDRDIKKSISLARLFQFDNLFSSRLDLTDGVTWRSPLNVYTRSSHLNCRVYLF